MGSRSQQYCLRWKNHSSNLLNVFEELLQNEAFTDVTLAVEGGASIKCHKMVLAACSSYFQHLFIDLPCKHPIVVLKDVKYSEMKAILEYIYRGEVNVAQEQLGGLLNVAEVLKVKGLVEENRPSSRARDEEVETSTSPSPAITTSTATSNGVAAHSSSGHASPIPHSTDGGGLYNPYQSSSTDGAQSRLTVPGMWPLPGLPLVQHPSTIHHPQQQQQHHHQHHHPHHHHPHHQEQQQQAPQPSPILGGSYDNGYENSPLKRKKISNLMINRDTPILRTVLGQEHADSSQPIPLILHPDGHESHARSSNGTNGSATDDEQRRNSTDLAHNENAHTSYSDGLAVEDDEKRASPQPYADAKSGSGCKKLKPQKPEWRRYKQYTREDLMSAIEAVKAGMSALRAAPKYGVPSRTLYDKLRNLGITTSRPFKRGSTGVVAGSACFPYGIGGNANGSIYPSGYLGEVEAEHALPADCHVGVVYEAGFKARATACERDSSGESRGSATTSVLRGGKRRNDEDEEEEEEEAVATEMADPEEDEQQADDLSIGRRSEMTRVIVPTGRNVENDGPVTVVADARN